MRNRMGLDLIDLYHRTIREKEELIELDYFIKNPKSKVKTIVQKIEYDRKLRLIKEKAFRKIENKFIE